MLYVRVRPGFIVAGALHVPSVLSVLDSEVYSHPSHPCQAVDVLPLRATGHGTRSRVISVPLSAHPTTSALCRTQPVAYTQAGCMPG